MEKKQSMLAIFLILINRTDEKHKLTQKELADILGSYLKIEHMDTVIAYDGEGGTGNQVFKRNVQVTLNTP